LLIITICHLAAASHIENVAQHINESIRKQDNFKKMLIIQNSLTGLTAVPSIISPARLFIKEGKMMKVCYLYLDIFQAVMFGNKPNTIDI